MKKSIGCITAIATVASLACTQGGPIATSTSAEDTTEPAATCSGQADGFGDSVDQTFQTVKGASVTLHVVPFEQGVPSSAGCAAGGVAVTYLDAKGFYASEDEIQAVATLHTHVGSAVQVNSSATVALARAPQGSSYSGLVCGLSAGQIVDLVEIAFVDDLNAAQPLWDSNNSSNYTAFLSDSSLSATSTTVEGATLEADFVLSWPSGADCVSPGFDVTYTDRKGYFDQADHLQAFVKVDRHHGTVRTSASHTVTLLPWGDPSAHRYGFLFCGALDDDTVVDSVEIAVSNPDGSKWDSNESENYELRCEL